MRHSRKKVHANLPADDLVQKGARSKKGPALKRKGSGGLSQENAATLSGDQATPEGQPPHRRHPRVRRSPVESASEGSAAHEHPKRRKKEDRRRGRSPDGETSSDPQSRTAVPVQQPVKDMQAEQGASQTQAKLCPGGLCFQAARQREAPGNTGSPGNTSPGCAPESRHLQGSRAAGRGGFELRAVRAPRCEPSRATGSSTSVPPKAGKATVRAEGRAALWWWGMLASGSPAAARESRSERLVSAKMLCVQT